jgi:hypothetical protein
MTAALESSCLLLCACVVQASLLIALFGINSNADVDTYFLNSEQITPDVVLQLNDIMNQTHPRGWPGPTVSVLNEFSIIPISICLTSVLMFGLFVQFWTYRMSTTSDVWMESYTPEVLGDHQQWDILFLLFIGCEHAVSIILLCSPLSANFVMFMTLLVVLVIVERCAPRPDDGPTTGAGSGGTFATMSLAMAAFVGFRILSEQKRHIHSGGVFFIIHVLLDMALVMGHTWDARTHQFATVINCRAFFVVGSSALIFTMFVTHCTHISGRDSVAGMVSGIYNSEATN